MGNSIIMGKPDVTTNEKRNENRGIQTAAGRLFMYSSFRYYINDVSNKAKGQRRNSRQGDETEQMTLCTI